MKDSTERLVTEYPQPLAAAAAPPTGLARTAARLGGYALASRLLGLLRDMSMAWLAGSGPAADALAAALRLPHILRRLLGEGSLSMSLTAALVRQCRPDTAAGRVCLGQVGRALAVRLGLPLTLLTLLAVAAAPWIMAGLAPGFAGPERERAVFLLRLCLPYGLAAGMAALGTALLHSLGLFRLPGLSPVLFNATALASSLTPGLVASLYYAERLLELPLGLVGVCLGTASLPALSLLAAEGRYADFAAALGTALRLTLLLSLPATAGLWAVGAPLVRGLFCHGAFDAAAAQATWLALAASLPGLPALACNRSLLAACNALGEERRTALSALAAVAATLAVGAALVHSCDAGLLPLAPALAPPLAAGAGLWVQTGLLLRTLVGALQRGGASVGLAACLPGGAALLRQGLAALAAGLAARALMLAAEVWSSAAGPALALALSLSVAGGVTAWALCLLALRDGDMLALCARVRERAHL